jgi:N-acetylglucosaminyl-diphospho-decaprenol L-rhamnosyltransferase
LTSVSILVVSYNTCDLLRACLTSASRDGRAEVIVVDNASTDGSPAMVAAEFPEVRLLARNDNLGFVRANNLAFAQSSGDYVLLLNPDAELQGPALDALAGFLDRTPAAAVVGPRLTYPDGRFQHAAFRFPTLAQTYFDFFHRPARLLESSLNGRYSLASYRGGPFRADFVLGACMMVRRRAAEAVGLLDEAYFMYCEEMDWCRRFAKSGWQTWCLPAAHVVHHEGQSSRQKRWTSWVEKWQSRRLFFRRYCSPLWQAVNARVVRAGLAAEARSALAALAHGESTSEEVAQHLNALREVRSLFS